MTDLEYDRVREHLQLFVAQTDLEIWEKGYKKTLAEKIKIWNMHLNNLKI